MTELNAQKYTGEMGIYDNFWSGSTQHVFQRYRIKIPHLREKKKEPGKNFLTKQNSSLFGFCYTFQNANFL